MTGRGGGQAEIGVLLLDSRGVGASNNTIADGEHGERAICFNPAPGLTAGLGLGDPRRRLATMESGP